MPIGSLDAAPHVARHVLYQRPARVLDLGIGSGFYGAIVRQWADEGVRPWRTWLVGVEGWADYRNPLWDLYDMVFTMTIEEFLSHPNDPFDCVMLNDVLEHFDRPTGAALLQRLKQQVVASGGTLWVNTPAQFCPQEAAHGNELERHRSLWTAADLESLGFATVLSGQEPQLGPVPTVLSRWDHRS